MTGPPFTDPYSQFEFYRPMRYQRVRLAADRVLVRRTVPSWQYRRRRDARIRDLVDDRRGDPDRCGRAGHRRHVADQRVADPARVAIAFAVDLR